MSATSVCHLWPCVPQRCLTLVVNLGRLWQGVLEAVQDCVASCSVCPSGAGSYTMSGDAVLAFATVMNLQLSTLLIL